MTTKTKICLSDSDIRILIRDRAQLLINWSIMGCAQGDVLSLNRDYQKLISEMKEMGDLLEVSTEELVST